MKRYVTIITIIGMISAGLVFSTGALAVEEIQEQAPLVFEYNLTGPKVFESQIVETDGLISEIRVSWDFEGEARLEVSANAGSSYAPVVNGQALTEGFIPGNQLRFRVYIADDSRLKKIVLGHKDSSGTKRFFLNKDFSSFRHHKIIEISGSDKELFNYPLKLTLARSKGSGPVRDRLPEATDRHPRRLISNGVGDYKKIDVFPEDIKEDFSDARFSAPDGQTPLKYYLEKVYRQDDVVLADFWVKIPQLPKEGIKIHIYSVNKEAKDESDPQSVFLFFDDFNSSVLDEQKWQARLDLESKYSLKAGYLELKNCSILSRVFKMKSGILEFKAKAGENSAVQAIVKKSSPYQGEAGWGKSVLESRRQGGAGRPGYAIEHLVYSSGYPGAEHTIAVNDMVKVNSGIPIKPREDYIYRVTSSEATGEIIFERCGLDYQKQAEIRFLGADNSREGFIGLKSSGGLSGEPGAYFDWVRVRPYVEAEPKIQIE